MDLDLSILIVWLFLGLGLGVFGLLITLTLANTFSAIKPETQRHSLPSSPSRNFWPAWFSRLRPSKSPESSSHSQTDLQDLSSPLPTPQLPPLACDLEIRAVTISTSCCLLHTKKGRPLHGGAVATRLTRLQRMGILV